MGIESGVVTRLNAVASVTALVSNRIYADVAPEGAELPSIVYQLISTIPFDSNLNADGGKFVSRFQFVLLTAPDNKLQVIQLTDAVKLALIRFQGAADDITILDSRLENILDQAYDLVTDKVSRMIDFKIYWE